MISAEEKMPPTEVASASQNEALSRLERVRLKNSKAQKKYRQKKLDERRQLQQQAEELAALVSKAEAERAAISAQIAELQARLHSGNAALLTTPKDSVYVPAETHYEGLDPTTQQSLRLQHIFDPPRTWTFAEAMRLTVKEHCEMRKEFVLRAGQLLLANPEQDPDSPEGQQLHALMNEFWGLVAYLAIFNPKMLYSLFIVRGDTLERAQYPDSGHWLSILKRLKISKSQEEYLVGLMRESSDRMQQLTVERRRLHKAIAACMDATEISGHMSSESILHTFNHVYFASLVRGLRDNVDNTHVENCKFAIKSGCTWAQQFSSTGHPLGLDGFQEAQLLTLSWPYFPSKMLLIRDMFMRATGESKEASKPAPVSPGPGPLAADDEPYKPVPYKILEEYMQQKLKLCES